MRGKDGVNILPPGQNHSFWTGFKMSLFIRQHKDNLEEAESQESIKMVSFQLVEEQR